MSGTQVPTISLSSTDISSSSFTDELQHVSPRAKQDYLAILRPSVEEDVREIRDMKVRNATALKIANSEVEAARAKVVVGSLEGEQELDDAKERHQLKQKECMFEELVHAAKHEGLVALVKKLEESIRGDRQSGTQ